MDERALADVKHWQQVTAAAFAQDRGVAVAAAVAAAAAAAA